MSPGTISSTLSDDAFFRHHQLSPKREAHLGRPVKSLIDGEWVITLSRRFNKPDGTAVNGFAMLPKAIHDEMGAAFDEYGRMAAKLGLELPSPSAANANFRSDQRPTSRWMWN